MAGIRREELPEGKLERVILDVKAAPLSEQHSQMLSQWLGPATDQRLAPVEGDVVSFEAVLRGGTFFSAGDHHLFGAIRDADPAIALDANAGLIPRLVTSKLEGLQGYVGAWPNPGFLKLLSGFGESRPDAAAIRVRCPASGSDSSTSSRWSRSIRKSWPRFRRNCALRKPSGRRKSGFAPTTWPTRALAPFINAYGYSHRGRWPRATPAT